MSDKKEEIQVQTYNWGPCVIRLKMRDEFKKLLADEAKKNKLDFKNKLAGIIEKETGYSEESKAKIVPLLAQYLQIPDELKKENSEYVGRSCGPGGIQFIYGNGPRDCVTYQSFFPEEGDMYIFPAWLKHWVAPYKSDCTRISVSGNIHDSAPLNTIQRFAPEYLKDRDEKK